MKQETILKPFLEWLIQSGYVLEGYTPKDIIEEYNHYLRVRK